MNLRIQTSIDKFIKTLAEFFFTKKWNWIMPEKLGDWLWESPDFKIEVVEKYSNGAIQTIEFELRIPSITEITNNEPEISYQHIIHIILPWEYPNRVDRIKIVALTPIFHPRFSINSRLACINFNCELDDLLIELLFLLLFDPGRVYPPKLYKQSNYGCNYEAMKWFENNNLSCFHNFLLDNWHISKNRLNQIKNHLLDLNKGVPSDLGKVIENMHDVLEFNSRIKERIFTNYLDYQQITDGLVWIDKLRFDLLFLLENNYVSGIIFNKHKQKDRLRLFPYDQELMGSFDALIGKTIETRYRSKEFLKLELTEKDIRVIFKAFYFRKRIGMPEEFGELTEKSLDFIRYRPSTKESNYTVSRKELLSLYEILDFNFFQKVIFKLKRLKNH